MEWYNNPTCKPILDVCCGSRMFWFDKENPLALFTDIRDFEDTLCDGRHLSVHPDRIEDCTSLSFAEKSFKLVVFDPPHLVKAGENSWLAKKYRKLPKDWKAFINDSIHECMRVLDDYGVLIFKWNQDQIKVKDVINAITDYKPLFGHPTRRNETTIWMCFMKIPNANE